MNYTIKQGDTGPLLWVRPPGLSPGQTINANWVCRIRTSAGGINRLVTDKQDKAFSGTLEEYYLVALTPTETTVLPLGDLTLAIELENTQTTPHFRQERHIGLTIEGQLV